MRMDPQYSNTVLRGQQYSLLIKLNLLAEANELALTKTQMLNGMVHQSLKHYLSLIILES